MKVKNLLDTRVQVFNTVNDRVPNHVMTVMDILNFGVKYKALIDKARQFSGKENKVIEQNYKDIKSRMFCWLPSALCKDNKANIVHIYPVLCIDIDKQDNKDMDINTVKEQLIKLPFIYYVGLSFGGKGVFALALIEDALYYNEHFHAMESYLKENFNLVIDAQCGNINRLRFVSYDDNAKIKDLDADVQPFKELEWNNKKFEDETLQLNLFSSNKRKAMPDLLQDDNFCYAVIDYCIDKLFYQSGGRTSGWMQDLSACKSLGSIGESLALRISRQSNGYVSDNDVISVFNHKSTFSRRENITKFFKLCKEHFSRQNKNWILAIKELYELN